eukprot:6981050-Alexandrium_andersonii.AAC.1
MPGMKAELLKWLLNWCRLYCAGRVGAGCTAPLRLCWRAPWRLLAAVTFSRSAATQLSAFMPGPSALTCMRWP